MGLEQVHGVRGIRHGRRITKIKDYTIKLMPIQVLTRRIVIRAAGQPLGRCCSVGEITGRGNKIRPGLDALVYTAQTAVTERTHTRLLIRTQA